MPKHFFILAGELSGDKLGASLIKAIRDVYPDAIFHGIAGPEMQAAGCLAFDTIDALSVMGLTETLRKIPFFIKLKRKILTFITAHSFDAFIGIDFTEFNLSIEKSLRKAGVKTFHYKSPSVWAWRRGRLKTIKKAVDRMLLLFPFEKPLYDNAQIDARYIGHPLADVIEMENDKAHARRALNLSFDSTVITLMPGSRRQEINKLLPDFLQAARLLAKAMPDVRFVLPIAESRHRQLIESMVANYQELPLVLIDGQAIDAMCASDLVIVASGTATLEVMLVKRPMVVCYKLSATTYKLTKPFMYIDLYALPNILAGFEIMPELIQDALSPQAIEHAALQQLARPVSEWLPIFNQIHLSLKCNATKRAAEAVSEAIES